jgi:CubicO group peptidase (beta-lactamase class C family)
VSSARGEVAPGFENVRGAFERTLGGDAPGGAFAAVVDGRMVVDLWGGVADAETGRPWEEDTCAVLFSGTKGLVATCLLHLADRGRLSLDDPVSRYWPEFAAAGKSGVTVAQLAAHTAGLPALEGPLTRDDLHEPARLAARLAAQRPLWTDGTPSYHAFTHGWLCGEIVRRVDGRTVGRYLAEEIAAPLGIALTIGLAADDPRGPRLARLRRRPGYRLSAFQSGEPDPRLASVYPLERLGGDVWNDRQVLAAEMPAAGGVGTASAMARLYGSLVSADRPLVHPASLAAATSVEAAGDDPLTGRLLRFGPTGFELAGTPSQLGPAPDAFGHTGAGGSSHGGWPGSRTGFSFLSAELWTESEDRRARTVLEELHRAVAAR